MEINELYGERGSTSGEKREHHYGLYAKRITNIGSDQQIKLDYDIRTDDNPVYVGRGAKNLLVSSDGWLIYKLIYDTNTRLTSVTAVTGIWNNRETLF